MPNERPLIFSAAMVRALIAGTKVQTRRLVEPQPPDQEAVRRMAGTGYSVVFDPAQRAAVTCGPAWAVREKMGREPRWHCPYGLPGDRIWVREAYRLSGFYQDDVNDDADVVERPLVRCTYAADGASRVVRLTKEEGRKLAKRSMDRHRELSGRFMYRSCSRITLELTEVRVQRVQDIAPEDVWAEGLPRGIYRHAIKGFHPCDDGDEAQLPDGRVFKAVAAYGALWDTLHLADGHVWETNPYVWALEFRLLAVATEGATSSQTSNPVPERSLP